MNAIEDIFTFPTNPTIADFAKGERKLFAHLQFLSEQKAYIELNNLYISIECGDTKLTITTANRLRVLVSKAYDRMDDVMPEWWANEFTKLPNWLSV